MGLFKGRVEVLDGSSPQLPAEEGPHTAAPAKYMVHLYTVKTHGLLPPHGVQPRDLNPYLRIFNGSKEVNLRSKALYGTDDPDFRTLTQLPVTLPGRCKLQIQVWHAAPFLQSDVLLGQTEIDLENRVLSPDWVALTWPKGKAAATRSAGSSCAPLELRALKLGSQVRGKLEVMVEIFDPKLAIVPLDISLPPPEKFVMRVVVWSTAGIPVPKSVLLSTGMIDMYVRLILEGRPPTKEGDIGSAVKRWVEETDTHWRAKKGRGSFNWRSVFDVELPLASPRLTIQVWDHDLIAPDAYISQGGVDLSELLNTAWRRFQATGGKGSKGAVFTLPDRSRLSEAKAPKKLDHQGKPKAPNPFAGATSAWGFLCHAGSSTYRRAHSLVSKKGKGDGEWIELYNSKGDDAGVVSVSITLMHADAAKTSAAGPGRSEPNDHPKLPAPERVSWNPLRPDLILLDLLGPELLTKIVVLLVLVLLAYFVFNSLPIIMAILASHGI